MSHAEKCPVCGGDGWYPPTFKTFQNACHGCDGKGWVEVGDTSDRKFGHIHWCYCDIGETHG